MVPATVQLNLHVQYHTVLVYRIVTFKFSTIAGTIYSVDDVKKDALTQNFNILS